MEKLRSLFQRARARDYFDLYKLITSRNFDRERIRKALIEKSTSRKVKLYMDKLVDQSEDVRAYWDKALDRLTSSKPDFDEVNDRIQDYLKALLE